jgi:hypothetical protein
LAQPTVLLHEIGHLVGFDHDAASAVPAMQEVLEAGTHAPLVASGGASVAPLPSTQQWTAIAASPRYQKAKSRRVRLYLRNHSGLGRGLAGVARTTGSVGRE